MAQDGESVSLVGLREEHRLYLEARRSSNQVANKIPRGEQRLRLYSVICFIVNRMIGTGIFNSPGTVIRGTQSVGVSLLFWACGAINAFAVTFLYIEYGLTIPRYDIGGGGKVSVPRSGGELNYFNYLIRRPPFLATCIFGFTFILLGSSAGNAISFGNNILISMPDGPRRDSAVRGIAIGVITIACLIHGLWRKAGILLNNGIASIKVLIICTFPVLAVCALLGVGHTNHAKENMSVKNSFANASPSAYGWSNAFLPIIFAFNGFNQVNYVSSTVHHFFLLTVLTMSNGQVLSEIDRPREIFPKGAKIAVALVSFLYIATNISYMIVVSKDDQLNEPKGVALAFFRNFMGERKATHMFAACTGISSLGNIIVTTFTSARVKQEIAKEGILPFAKLIGESSSKGDESIDPNTPDPGADPIPVGALVLHWLFSVLLVCVTWPTKPSASYKFFVSETSYAIDAFFSTILGIGMLCLRFMPTSSGGSWRDKSSANHTASIISAVICVIANGFPIVASWFPPTSKTPQAIKEVLLKYLPWYLIATIGWSVLACSVIYWMAFRFVLPRLGNRRGLVFVVEREPFLHTEHGYYVQYHEIVTFSWVAERRTVIEEYQLDEQPPSPGAEHR